tara:strand:- start:182 stop:847 length:666 start_codon:yes stop_codon:yes gene_type:complete
MDMKAGGVMKLGEAKEITGHKSGLGKPSKMPGWSTSLSAFDCKVGSKLVKVEGSVCSKCYAFNGNYRYQVVKDAHQARLKALQDPRWVEAMTLLIGHYTDPADPYFRIHDSGDIQSVEHLLLWVEVAKALPNVQFWMPTKEYRMYREGKALVARDWPDNLVVRLSAPMIGKNPPKSFGDLPTSTVAANMGFECEAYKRGNICGDCRACWTSTVSNIDYHVQ